jgi:hypothetical protein
MKCKPNSRFKLDKRGILWFDERLVVPKDQELWTKILDEAHQSKLSVHPGSSKMYCDLKSKFWWTKMKKEIAAYVARCDNCCRVKAIHMKLTSLLQSLSIYLNGNGRRSVWISLLDFLLLKKAMTQYG